MVAARRGRARVSRPEPVYAVCFRAAELWGSGSHSVILDMWESYLEEAS